MLRAITLLLLAVVGTSAGHGGPTAADPSPRGPFLLVANKGDQTLGIIDPVAGTQVATVEESGITGHEVVASADGRIAYVPIFGDSGVGKPGSDGQSIDVIDIAARELVETIEFDAPQRPHCAVFGTDGLLYVSAEVTNSIKVIDPATNAVLATIPTGQAESHMLTLSSDGKRAYTSNVGPGTVSVIDVPTRSVTTVIPVSGSAQRIALSVDDRWLFTADQTQPRLAVIDTATNEIAAAGSRCRASPTGPRRTPGRPLAGPRLWAANQVGALDLNR